MRNELVRGAAVRLQRVFARHLDVAAQGQGADAVVGITFAKAHQALAKSDGKDVNPDAKQLGCGIMAELVDQDHDPKHDRHPGNVSYRSYCK